MSKNDDVGRLLKEFEALLSNTAAGSPIDVETVLAGLRASLLSGNPVKAPDPETGESEDDEYVSFRDGANTNLNQTEVLHHLAWVEQSWQRAGLFTRRVRRLWKKAFARGYIFCKTTDRFDMAEIIKDRLGEKFSNKNYLSQMIRVFFGWPKLEGDDKDTKEENAARTQSVYYVRSIYEELRCHFDNERLRFENYELVEKYLDNRDKWFNISETKVVAGIAQAMTLPDTEKGDDEKSDEGADKKDKDQEGQVQPKVGEGDSGDKPPHPITKAEAMVGGAPEKPLDELLAPHRNCGKLVLVAYRLEPGGHEAAIASVPCDAKICEWMFKLITQNGPDPALTFFHEAAVIAEVLDTPSSTTAGGNAIFEPGAPTALVTVDSGGFISQVSASDSQTSGTVMITLGPVSETRLRGGQEGHFVIPNGFANVPAKGLGEAIAANAALLRVTPNDHGGFNALITVPSHPGILIPFMPPAAGQALPYHPANLADFTTRIELIPEHLRILRDATVKLFLTKSANHQQTLVIALSAHEGKLMLEIPADRRQETYLAEIVEDAGDAAQIRAVDFFMTIDAITKLKSKFSVSININCDGVVGIRAVTDHTRIEAVIPPVINGSLDRSGEFAARTVFGGDVMVTEEPTAEVQEPAAPEPSETVTAPAKPKRKRTRNGKATTSQPEGETPTDAAPKRRLSRPSKKSD